MHFLGRVLRVGMWNFVLSLLCTSDLIYFSSAFSPCKVPLSCVELHRRAV